MPVFEIETEFTLRGTFSVRAETLQEAIRGVKDHCGMVSGKVHSTLPDKDINWNFPIHPDKRVGLKIKGGRVTL